MKINTSLKFVLSLLGTLMLISCSEKKYIPETDQEISIYGLGVRYGANIAHLGLNEKELNLLMQGFRDSARQDINKAFNANEPGRNQKIDDLIQGKMNTHKNARAKSDQEFIEQFVAKGGLKSASGLAYQISQEGEGDYPKEDDLVEMHYTASMPDGRILLSTQQRGEASLLPMNKLLTGWSEGLRLIKPGGKIRLVLPPELAYGENGSPPDVPPGAVIVLDVELVSIKEATETKTHSNRK